jgi:hypothetical protein
MLTITLFVILSEAKNLMFLLNFSPNVLTMSYNKTYKKFSKMTLTEKWKMEGLQQGLQQGLIKAKQEDILKANQS